MKIKSKCDYCDKIIYKYHFSFDNYEHLFCSQICHYKFMITGKKIKCDYCKKNFFRRLSVINKYKHNFCSRECSNKFKTFNKRKILSCDNCSKKISVILFWSTHKKNHFCSEKCRKKFFTKKYYKIINCAFCEKKFKRNNSRILENGHNFCSRLCYGKWSSIHRKGKNSYSYLKNRKGKNLLCTNCKKKIYVSPRRLIHFKNFYCNNVCKLKYQVGKNHPEYLPNRQTLYPIEFDDKLREFIRKRDGFYCQNSECGIPQLECSNKLSVHHIDYNKNNNDPINLIALCQKCHHKSCYNRKYWQTYYENIQIKREVHTLEKYVV